MFSTYHQWYFFKLLGCINHHLSTWYLDFIQDSRWAWCAPMIIMRIWRPCQTRSQSSIIPRIHSLTKMYLYGSNKDTNNPRQEKTSWSMCDVLCFIVNSLRITRRCFCGSHNLIEELTICMDFNAIEGIWKH